MLSCVLRWSAHFHGHRLVSLTELCSCSRVLVQAVSPFSHLVWARYSDEFCMLWGSNSRVTPGRVDACACNTGFGETKVSEETNRNRSAYTLQMVCDDITELLDFLKVRPAALWPGKPLLCTWTVHYRLCRGLQFI